MDAINKNLKKLESVEAELYAKREVVNQRRLHEDKEREAERQREDDEYHSALADRDHKEGELRRQLRVLGRSPVAGNPKSHDQSETLALPKGSNKHTTSSRARRKKKSAAADGPPTTHDSQGNPLWSRPSDGKLVYLRCNLGGCGRTEFATVRSLRRHISAFDGFHKGKWVFHGIDDAIEACGEVAPGQEEPSSRSDALSIVPKQDRAHRGTNRESKSRAQKAAEMFEGYLSSDSVESDEDEPRTSASLRTKSTTTEQLE